jgi:hypothetical protein
MNNTIEARNVNTDRPALWALFAQLCDGFEDGTRCDGGDYRFLKDDMPNRDRWQEIIRLCHRGELPDDWRYNTISRLADDLLDRVKDACLAGDEPDADDLRDYLWEISDCLTATSHSDLFSWLADHPGRAEFDEDGSIELDSSHLDLGALAGIRQREEIEAMANILLDAVDEWTQELEDEEYISLA